MNKLLIIFLSAALMAASPPFSCDEALKSACIGKMPDGYNFLKVFSIDGEGGQKQKVEHSYVFTKDTFYAFNICSAGTGTDGIVLTIYDSNRNKMVSTKTGSNIASAVAYQCGATGIYYLQYTFDAPTQFCGTSVLAFKR